MNPLNVLRGGALMTPAASLRRARRRSASRQARPHPRAARSARAGRSACTLDGAGRLDRRPRTAATVRRRVKSDIIVAPIDLKMRSAIELRRRSGNPIVLVDQLGRMAGLCGDDEIYRALLQQRRAAVEG